MAGSVRQRAHRPWSTERVNNLTREIIRARELGFCFGVRRAIDLMEKAAQKYGRIETLGDIVHNRQVVERLAEMGVIAVPGLEGVTGDTVAITAHGAGPHILEEAQGRKLKVLDTTCPIVKRAQGAAKTMADAGFTVLIFGDPRHPEVIGIKGWAGESALVTTTWPVVDHPRMSFRKTGLLAQTTQSPTLFLQFTKAVLDSLWPKTNEVRIFNTICEVSARQKTAALKLAREVDLMIVVGGRASANTRHLAELCRSIVETHQVETTADLDPLWFEGKRRVGVTAGTSTPDWVIDEVTEAIPR